MDLSGALSKLDAPTAVDIIVAVTRATSSKAEAIAALRKLASGRDGVAGTADDLIPASVVGVLEFLLENEVAADIVALVPTGAFGVLAKRAVQFFRRLCGGGGAAAS